MDKKILEIVGARYYLKEAFFQEKINYLSDIFKNKFSIHSLKSYSLNSIDNSGEIINKISINITDDFLFDFSAYYRSFKLSENVNAYLLFNDTLFLKHPYRLILSKLSEISSNLVDIGVPAIAGKLDPNTNIAYSNKASYSKYHISTFCFLMNYQAAEIFDKLINDLPKGESLLELSEWIDEKVTLYPPLKWILHVHLFGEKNPWSWSNLSKDMKEIVLLRKAVTVILEYTLSEEILKNEGILYPVNYNIEYKIFNKLWKLKKYLGKYNFE